MKTIAHLATQCSMSGSIGVASPGSRCVKAASAVIHNPMVSSSYCSRAAPHSLHLSTRTVSLPLLVPPLLLPPPPAELPPPLVRPELPPPPLYRLPEEVFLLAPGWDCCWWPECLARSSALRDFLLYRTNK